MTPPRIERLVTEHTEVVVVLGDAPPAIAHWGAPLGPDADLDALLAVHDPGMVPGTPVWRAPLPVVPEHGSGFDGRPGLTGFRAGGTDFAPRLRTEGVERDGRTLTVTSTDEHAGLRLVTTVALGEVLSLRAVLTNTGTTDYHLQGLALSLPLPAHAAELLTLGGRWTAEFRIRRTPWPSGTLSAENRRGRTSHESAPLVIAGARGFGEWHGQVWAAHLAWSGNHQWHAERTAEGIRHLQLGELLHPGEVVMAPGADYATPEIIAVHSEAGLTPATWGFHRHLRSLPVHPTTPRPVTFNSWEATYFDHDAERLAALAATAADVGAERFVLDDGWFGGRRDDTAGLGDWWVSPDAHPDGLAPLIDTVHRLGLQFGIWVEPEMVNPDSELYRAHPEWALVDHRYEPVMHRNQLVLDLTHPDAFAHIHGAIDRLLADHAIDFVKWDMNRPHIQATDAAGAAGTHRQTLALYRLLDLLRASHPAVEFESCSSGGARIDHEILRRTHRVWTSDSNDPLERQRIQYGASMLIPPELMGAHIGPRHTHTTGRAHHIEFRAITAMMGHLGIEADLGRFSDDELEVVRAAIGWYRAHRDLLHTGDVVRFEIDEPWLAHGVYATDRSRGVVSVASLDVSTRAVMPPLLLPGLDPERRYRVTPVHLPHAQRTSNLEAPAWWRNGALEATGAQLAAHGVRTPTPNPSGALLLELEAVARS